jgi:hypothetical protein
LVFLSDLFVAGVEASAKLGTSAIKQLCRTFVSKIGVERSCVIRVAQTQEACKLHYWLQRTVHCIISIAWY